ncbi:MAG: hypothetical protein AAFV77_06800 [Planctomycetota bacterium]
MRRVAFMLGLLLLLGLCTSLLVAWAGALLDRSAWPDTPLTGTPTGTRTEMRGWLVEEGRDRTLTWRTFVALDLWDEPPDLEAPTNLPAWSVGHGLADQPGPFAPARERTLDRAWEVSAGWPMRCVRAVREAGPIEFALPGEFVRGGAAAMPFEWPASTSAVAGAGGIAIVPWPVGDFTAALPLRPMPVGLLVNTSVFAALWFVALLPLAGLRVLRRRRRGRKNRCVACGYARDGLPVDAPCAECGRDPSERTTLGQLLTARAPMLGAALALVLVFASSAALATHRWMAVDRLPPLHHAAAVGDVEAIERLISGGADPDAVFGLAVHRALPARETTALSWSAARGQRAAAAALLDAGADPHEPDGELAPLVLAMERWHDPIVLLLLLWVHPAERASIVPWSVAMASDAMRARALERHHWSDESRLDALWSAVEASDPAWLATVHALGVPPQVHEVSIMARTAAQRDAYASRHRALREDSMIAHMLRLGLLDGYRARRQAVDSSIGWGLIEVFDRILADDPSRREVVLGWSARAVRNAARSGQVDMIRHLHGLGVELESGGMAGGTPLLSAAQFLQYDAVVALLECGVDPTFGIRVPFDPDSEVTPRGHLAEQRAEAIRDRAHNPDSRYLVRADEVQRILDMLEAAEAEWDVRESDAGDTAVPGGP